MSMRRVSGYGLVGIGGTAVSELGIGVPAEAAFTWTPAESTPDGGQNAWVWLDAGQDVYSDNPPTTLAGNGDSVQFWTNQGTLARDWYRAGADGPPTYRTGIINSLPVVEFDDVDDRLFAGGAVTTATYSVFAVILAKAAQVNQWWGGVATNRQIRINDAGANPVLDVYNGVGAIASNVLSVDPVTAWSLSEYFLSGTMYSFRQNGSDMGTVVDVASTFYLDYIPRNAVAAPQQIAEILAYNALLSDDDKATVETYFKLKYALW